ncbi:hypothetical protein Rhopal_003731-T1 [Rhodotorula paludigena]|uniref:SNF5-domain-containing protein n=1 Tax=Rhodotorula paludigena TaxID=86838 RepID=A0AAV5GMY7_9BASI|nr:hypothetical protein Rhopal_003731-T1 [Rhodotorula paludigena]
MSGYDYSSAAGGAQGGAFASTSSGAAPPAIGGSTRSGRQVKPVKPYTAPAQPTRARSSLNPHKNAAAHAAALAAAAAAGPPLPPQRHPLSAGTGAVPPLTRITGRGNEAKQALFTTYPARMRLGTSSLVQPSALGKDGPAAGKDAAGTGSAGTGASTPIITGSRRVRSTVNYADLENLDDPEDDSDAEHGAGGRLKRGGSGTPGVAAKKAKVETPKAEPKPEVWGDGKSYLGVLPPGNLVQVQPVKATKHSAFTEEQLEEHADVPGAFIPVQIDIDVDTFKIRDSFVWNVNEKLISPMSFARVFCDDLDIDVSHANEIARQIQEQVDDYTAIAQLPIRSEEEEKELVEKDWRVVVNLDVQIGTLHLTDKLEWDLSSSLTPELFAATLVRDLSLSSSAAPLIAHALHEELLRLKRSCLELGLLSADDATRNRRGAKALEGVWREWNDADKFGPKVERMSLDELDRVEADRERAARRQKRDRQIGGPRVAARPRR